MPRLVIERCSRGRLAIVALLLVVHDPALPAQASAPAPSNAPAPASCPLTASARNGGELAVVLSGGGARGLAHIGVLRVLDSLGVRPAMVVGTSMGALVGALYAGGVPGWQLDSIARRLPLSAFFRRYTPVAYLSTGDFSAPVTVMTPAFVVEMRAGRVKLQSPLAREPQINALFNQLLLRANLDAAGDFDRLPRRFRAVATDMRTRLPVELSGGDLAQAVRASIAIPVVFAPVELQGRLLVDGGLSDNVPVDLARRMGAARVFVSDVGTIPADSLSGATTASMLSYLVDELFTQPYSLGDADLLVRPEVRRFNPLEFSRAVIGPLIDAGYEAARETLAGCAPAPAPPAGQPRPAEGSEAEFIADRLARLADEESYEAVWLRPRLAARPDTLPDTTGRGRWGRGRLDFAPVAVPMPQRTALGGLSYDGHQGARIWLSLAALGAVGGSASLGGVLTIGEWRQQLVLAVTELRRHPLPRATDDSSGGSGDELSLPDPRAEVPPWSTVVRKLLRPEASLTGSREVVRLYDDRGGERDHPYTRDLVLFTGATVTPEVGQRVAIGAVAHAWSVRSGALSEDDENRAFGVMVRAVRSFTPPSSGPNLSLVPRVAAEAMYLDRYRRADIDADLNLQYGDLVLRPRAGAGWGEGVPLATQLTLGGPEGFPGLRTGERRGDRAAFVALAMMHRVAGPLYVRAELGVGTTSISRVRHPEILGTAGHGSVSGGELGLATDTPIGPFVMSYGLSSTDRPVFKIRVGS